MIKASFVATQIIMSKNKCTELIVMIYFQDNDLANQKKHDHGFKTRPHIDTMNADFSIV